MNKPIIAIFTLILSASLFSCGNPEQKAKLKKVDSLKTTLDSIDQKLDVLDSAEVARNFEKVERNFYLMDSITQDSLDTALLGANKKAEKVFRRYLSNIEKIKKELRFSYAQLDSLRFDVENELVTKKDFGNYYQDEEYAINNLKDLSYYIVQTTKKQMESFDSLQTEMERYIKEKEFKNQK